MNEKNEESDARLARVAMQSLSVEAPADLKEELKRRARARVPQLLAPTVGSAPSIFDGLREALAGRAWAYGAGAAFSAASVAAFIWSALPAGVPAPEGLPVAVESGQVPAADGAPAEVVPVESLADLWTDDDGEDHDDI
jgi:hypothetical protein